MGHRQRRHRDPSCAPRAQLTDLARTGISAAAGSGRRSPQERLRRTPRSAVWYASAERRREIPGCLSMQTCVVARIELRPALGDVDVPPGRSPHRPTDGVIRLLGWGSPGGPEFGCSSVLRACRESGSSITVAESRNAGEQKQSGMPSRSACAERLRRAPTSLPYSGYPLVCGHVSLEGACVDEFLETLAAPITNRCGVIQPLN